jgi:hypothetical protein
MAGFLSPRRVLGRGVEGFLNRLWNSAKFAQTAFSEVGRIRSRDFFTALVYKEGRVIDRRLR